MRRRAGFDTLKDEELEKLEKEFARHRGRWLSAIIRSPDLTDTQKIILAVVIAEHLNRKIHFESRRMRFWASLGTLAKQSCRDERNVRRALRTSEGVGEPLRPRGQRAERWGNHVPFPVIVAVTSSDGGYGITTRYDLNEPWLEETERRLQAIELEEAKAAEEKREELRRQRRSRGARQRGRQHPPFREAETGAVSSEHGGASIQQGGQQHPKTRTSAPPDSYDDTQEIPSGGTLSRSLEQSAKVTIDIATEERERPPGAFRSRAEKVVEVFPPECRGPFERSVSIAIELGKRGVDLDELARAAARYVMSVDKTDWPRYCKSVEKWLAGEPWRPDFHHVAEQIRASAAVAWDRANDDEEQRRQAARAAEAEKARVRADRRAVAVRNFSRFWDAYPAAARKRHPQLEDIFARSVENGWDVDEIVSGVEAYRASFPNERDMRPPIEYLQHALWRSVSRRP